MSSPVKDAKIEHISKGFTEVSERNRGSLTSHRPGTEQYAFTTQVGGRGWHFGDGPFTEEHEVDTAWVDADPILDAPWQKKMVLADYNAYAFREPTLGFDQGQLIEYVHPASGEAVTFQPMQLQWANDIGQISPIEDPQAVSATIDDDMLTWANVYGAGIDFRWIAGTQALYKQLIINSLASLGTPPQFIIDGGNPVLKLQFIFQKSTNVEIWVDGTEWNEKSNNPVSTVEHVEFRDASGTLWYFKRANAGQAIPDDENTVEPITHFRALGQDLFVEIRVPWSWLQTASYPVTIDPTVDESVVADDDDCTVRNDTSAWWSDPGPGFHYLGAVAGTGRTYECGYRFTTVAIEGTIDVAYITLANGGGYAGTVLTKVHADDTDDAAIFSTYADFDGRSLTTAGVDWDDPLFDAEGVTENSPSIVSVIQEIVDRGGWSSGNDLAILHKDDGSAQDSSNFTTPATVEHASYAAPALHVEYTAASGGPTEQSTGGTLTLTGASWQTTLRDQEVAGTLVLAGIISDFKRALNRTYGGTLTLDGSIATMFKSFLELVGTVVLSGVLQMNTLWKRALAGVLSLAGTISASLGGVYLKVLSGVLSFDGTISQMYRIQQYLASGTLVLSGAITDMKLSLTRFLAGTLTFSSAVISRFMKFVVATVRLVLKPIAVVRTWLDPDADVDIV